MSDLFSALANPAVIWVLIPLIAIIGSFVYKGLKLHYEHKERMAKIEFGEDPDEDGVGGH